MGQGPTALLSPRLAAVSRRLGRPDDVLPGQRLSRRRARPPRPWPVDPDRERARHGHYADDAFEVVEKLDLKNAIHIGHSTGGGEVTRYVARHGKGRVAKAVLISAIPPTFMKSERNPDGVPKDVVDSIRDGTAKNRSQLYKDITIPFYGFNRPGATVSEGIRAELVAARHDGGDHRPTRLREGSFPRLNSSMTLRRSMFQFL